MAYDHFAALVNSVRGDRSVRQIAENAGIPHHWLSYPLKPGTRPVSKPDAERIAALARALGVDVREVDDAFALDIGGRVEAPPPDPQTLELLRTWGKLGADYRTSLLQMAQALTHLQRKVGNRQDTPDLADAG